MSVVDSLNNLYGTGSEIVCAISVKSVLPIKSSPYKRDIILPLTLYFLLTLNVPTPYMVI